MSVSPLSTLQRLRFRPDQMLRRRSPTAKSTLTRAGDTSWLEKRGAIRERPFGCKKYLSW
jgi:hypothetical protein